MLVGCGATNGDRKKNQEELVLGRWWAVFCLSMSEELLPVRQ
jgi:hypothetical protein